MTTDRYSGPIGRLQNCEANGARSRLVRITFLGERQDIFDPVAAVPIAGTSHLQLLSVLERQPDWDSGVTHALWITCQY